MQQLNFRQKEHVEQTLYSLLNTAIEQAATHIDTALRCTAYNQSKTDCPRIAFSDKEDVKSFLNVTIKVECEHSVSEGRTVMRPNFSATISPQVSNCGEKINWVISFFKELQRTIEEQFFSQKETGLFAKEPQSETLNNLFDQGYFDTTIHMDCFSDSLVVLGALEAIGQKLGITLSKTSGVSINSLQKMAGSSRGVHNMHMQTCFCDRQDSLQVYFLEVQYLQAFPGINVCLKLTDVQSGRINAVEAGSLDTDVFRASRYIQNTELEIAPKFLAVFDAVANP